MGLRERKFKADLEQEIIPYWMRLIQEVVEKSIPIEIDWNVVGDRKFNDIQYIQTAGIEYIASALREIARRDALGKEAIQTSIQKVVLQQVDSMGEKRITLQNGVLTMNCDWREASLSYFLEHEIVNIVESLM